jgi:hypothetical protein
MAVREFGGVPVVIAENGVYQLSGDGPSNTGVGSFGAPVFTSDMGCSNADSVVRYPGGVMWQKGNYIAKFDGGQVTTFKNVLASEIISGSAVFKNQDEVMLFTASSPTVRVYNYAFDRWTVWNNQTIAQASSSASTTPPTATRPSCTSRTRACWLWWMR